MLKLIEFNIENRDNLEEFLKQNKSSLLQSFDWREFQEKLGRKSWTLGILEGENIIASALIIKYDLPLRKSYLYCPRGVVMGIMNNELREKVIKLLLSKIKEIANKENSIFFRMDPEWDNGGENEKLINSLKFSKSKKEANPKNTLILNISESEEEILKQMHSKTRYNIRLAERKGVKIRLSDGRGGDFESFWKLMEETTLRDGFKSHPKEYYKKQLDFFAEKKLIKLLVAELESEVISAIVVSFYGENAVYLHGASGYKHRKYMAPHLIQWEAIKEARRRGCKYYDFWGIEGSDQESKVKKQDWGGITRFKRGFAKEFGAEKNYIGAWDYPLNNLWYGIYSLVKK